LLMIFMIFYDIVNKTLLITLLVCSCAWVVGYPTTIERENACTIYCF
jgi:hypothetical protein